MPAVAQEDDKVKILPPDLAEYLDVSRTYLSKATQRRWHASSVDVEKYAVYETRNEARTSHYEFPVHMAVTIIPPSEQHKYDI
jgi:hypothetical protein